jgi:hypothetical protein
MLSNFSVSDVLHLVIVLAGAVFLLKKVAEMDRYHDLRVWALTLLLSCIVIYFFLIYGLTAGRVPLDDCVDFSVSATVVD